MSKGKYKRRKLSTQPPAQIVRPPPALSSTGAATSTTGQKNEWYQSVPKGVWTAIVAFGVILGILSAVYSFLPKISVSPAASLDRTNPFKTTFVLENESPFTIYSIQWGTQFPRMVTSNGGGLENIGTHRGFVAALDSHRKTSIDMWMPITIVGVPFVAGSAIITVSYRPSFYPRQIEETFRFQLSTNSDGEPVWLFGGQ